MLSAKMNINKQFAENSMNGEWLHTDSACGVRANDCNPSPGRGRRPSGSVGQDNFFWILFCRKLILY
jgi:hypothetical protein